MLGSMGAQAVAAGEALVAHRTAEGLQAGVHKRVCDELLGEAKVLAAANARESPSLGLQWRREATPAQITGFRQAICDVTP